MADYLRVVKNELPQGEPEPQPINHISVSAKEPIERDELLKILGIDPKELRGGNNSIVVEPPRQYGQQIYISVDADVADRVVEKYRANPTSYRIAYVGADRTRTELHQKLLTLKPVG